MDAKVTVGFIGMGRISDVHALGYLSDDRAHIAAVCARNVERAAAKAAQWGVPRDRAFADYHDLLALGDVNTVEILLPNHLHHEAVLEAIRAGKNVITQKPLAANLAEADEIIEAAGAAGVVLKVYDNFIFYPPFLRAKELVDQGAIGEVTMMRMRTFAGRSDDAWTVPADSWNWRTEREKTLGGSYLTDEGHHPYAMAWSFLGLPETVHAWHGTSVFSTSAGAVDLPCGVTWKCGNNKFFMWAMSKSESLEINTDGYYAADDMTEITGTHGVLWINHGHGRLLDVPPVVVYRDRKTTAYSDMKTDFGQSFVMCTRNSIDAVLGEGEPLLSGSQGRDLLRCCLAAEQSAESSSEVDL